MKKQIRTKLSIRSQNLKTSYPLVALIPALVFLVYFPTFSNGFVYDDHGQLVNNPYVRSFEHLKSIFATSVWFPVDKEPLSYYRPFHLTTYLLVYKAFGMSAIAFHLVNILLHCFCVLAVWKVSLYYLEKTPAFLASMLFAVHPINVESVAWIAGTPGLLCGAFLLLAFLLYLRGYLFWSLLPFACALLSKEYALLFPSLVCLDHYLFRRESNKRIISWIFAALIPIGTYLILRFQAMGSLINDSGLHAGTLEQILAAVTFSGFYIGKLVLPIELNAYYDYRIPIQLHQALVGISVLAIFCLIVFILRRNRTVLIGAGWFILLLLPALVLIGVSPPFFAERYMYIPAPGFLILVSALPLQKVRTPVLTVAIIVFGIITFIRTQVWHDDMTLWADTVVKSPNSGTAHFNLATTYLSLGNCHDAISEYERVINLDPTYTRAYYNLAACQINTRQYFEAEQNFRLFLAQYPKNDEIRREAELKIRQIEMFKAFRQLQ